MNLTGEQIYQLALMLEFENRLSNTLSNMMTNHNITISDATREVRKRPEAVKLILDYKAKVDKAVKDAEANKKANKKTCPNP